MPNRVFRRGAVYCFRAKYPAEVRHLFGSAERWKSLRTKEHSEAIRRGRIESVKFDAEMEALKRQTRTRQEAPIRTDLSRAEVDKIAAAYLHELMAEDEEMRAAGLTRSEYRSKQEAYDIVIPQAKRDAAIGNIEAWQDEFDDWLGSNGYLIDENSPTHRMVLLRMLREFIRYMEFVKLRQQGEPIETPPLPSESAGPTLAGLIDAYLSDPSAKRNAKTLLSYRIVFDVLKEIVGATKPARDVNRADCERVRDILIRLPSNARKKYPGVALSMTVELADKDKAHRLSPGTVNNYLNNLAALFNWGMDTWRVERNPAKGLMVHDPVPDGRKRLPFSLDMLPRLFDSPLYRGCQDDEAGYAKPGPNMPRRGRFWIPLLSLFHGIRLMEAAQLHVSDVTIQGGTCALILTDEGSEDMEAEDRKRIKTEAGKRYVPLHPELVRIGFLSFVDEARGHNRTRLFPDQRKDKYGYFSPFSKWFGRYLVGCGAKTKRHTFHSLRHTYRDALRRAEVPRDAAQALGGWASQGTDDDYGSGLDAVTLASYVGRVAFPGLDLSFLHETAEGEDTTLRISDPAI